MKPEDATKHFFRHRPAPVATPDMPQLMCEHGALQVLRKCEERGRHQDHCAPNSERHRLPSTAHEPDLGSSCKHPLQLIVQLVRGATPSQTLEPNETAAEPAQSKQ